MSLFIFILDSFYSIVFTYGAIKLIGDTVNILKTVKSHGSEPAFSEVVKNGTDALQKSITDTKYIVTELYGAIFLAKDLATGNKVMVTTDEKIVIRDRGAITKEYEDKLSELRDQLNKYKHSIKKKENESESEDTEINNENSESDKEESNENNINEENSDKIKMV